MPGDPLKKVQPGDPLEIPAQTFSTFIEAAQFVKAHQQNRGRDARPEFRQTGIVLVQNDSGADRDRFDVLGIDAPIITPAENLDEFQDRVTLACSTPVPGTHLGRFVILLEPIPSGEIGRAVVSGVVQTYLYVYEDAHEWADVHPAPTGDEAYRLTSAQYGGAQILWKQSGVGWKWAVVRLSGPELIRRIELAGDLAPGGWAYAYPLKPDDTPDTDPDRTFQVHDLLNKHWGWGRNESAYPYRGAWGYVKGHLDSGRWEVLDLEQLAHQVCVTLTEDMGETATKTAACSLDDHYRGTNPTLLFFTGSDRGPLQVKDPQNLFRRALGPSSPTGAAKGKATWDNRSQEYHLVECQQMATLIRCVTTAAVEPADDIPVSGVVLMQPIAGQSPVDGKATHDPTVMGIDNTFSERIANGTTLIAGWNEETDLWDVVEILRPGGRHVKAVSDWVDGNGDPHASCRHSSRAGTVIDESETPFDVYLAIRVPGGGSPADYKIQQTPNILQNDVFKYALDENGVPAGLDYLDAPHLTVRPFSGTVSRGWAVMDGTANSVGNGGSGIDHRRRFLVGYDSSISDYDTIGNTGGFWWHGDGDHTADTPSEENNNHPHHPELEHDLGSGVPYNINGTGLNDRIQNHPEQEHFGPFNDGDDTDNRPPYIVFGIEERIIPF